MNVTNYFLLGECRSYTALLNLDFYGDFLCKEMTRKIVVGENVFRCFEYAFTRKLIK